MSDVIVKLINPADSGRMFHYVHQDQVIDLHPGEFRFIDFDIVVAMFGHPGEVDEPNRRGRTDNFARIRAQWGYQTGALDAEEDWAAKAPKFRVETQDGEWIPMLLEDPEGRLPLPTAVGGSGAVMAIPVDPNVAVLTQTIERQQAQMDQLTAMLQSMLANQAQAAAFQSSAAGQVTVDLPPAVEVPATSDAPIATAATQVVEIPVTEAAPATEDAPPTTSKKSATRITNAGS